MLRILVVVCVLAAALIAGYRSGEQAPIDVVTAGEQQLGVHLESEQVVTNGIHLHVVMAGPKDGPPVVLLHGYPEFWWGWSQQMARLAQAGYRVIVPDQRGYNDSDKPIEIEAYRLENLALDVAALIKHLGYENVYLAGHDWGGVVAWRVAIDYPDRVRKFVVFNMGHPLAFAEARATPEKDETISWYRTFFQLPVLPEFLSRFGNWWLLAKNLRDTSRPGAFSESDFLYYKSAWAHDGAMRTMINWYRAAYRYPSPLTGDGMVRVPTRIVWGMRDAFLDPRLARLSAQHCTAAEVIELPNAGHWLLHEEPEVTSRQMIEFFR